MTANRRATVIVEYLSGGQWLNGYCTCSPRRAVRWARRKRRAGFAVRITMEQL